MNRVPFIVAGVAALAVAAVVARRPPRQRSLGETRIPLAVVLPHSPASLLELSRRGEYQELTRRAQLNARWLWNRRPDKRFPGTPTKPPPNYPKLLSQRPDELSTVAVQDRDWDPHAATFSAVDEYGRRYEGASTSGILDRAFRTFLDATALVPGWGTAASAGLRVAYELGRGESLSDAALAAARQAVPGGPVGQAAFDVGVGMALQGKRPAQAVMDAAREQVPPEYRAEYDLGVKTARRLS